MRLPCRITLLFLPPYSPYLNLIERFWKFFKRKVLYNRYYEAFDDYKAEDAAYLAQERRSRPLEAFAPGTPTTQGGRQRPWSSAALC